ncbi:acyl carrier protein [Streptomyces sp. CA-210063]|uniref:acyl carrier protein n=1 Tax=Streptomyces sp. CA-210063 TaxID=2801029 RepID=UPI00214A9BE1|nr:acyl carrier protein [Streptomyces sp. CA-210063]UUU30214.1 acyl carrier protein [Streptomyces sp. CA-210063]
MSQNEFTIDDLKRILLAGAGVDESSDLGGEILDTAFDDLGYDSLALLETGGRIEREYGIALDDEVFSDNRTPRALVSAVNRSLRAVAGA